MGHSMKTNQLHQFNVSDGEEQKQPLVWSVLWLFCGKKNNFWVQLLKDFITMWDKPEQVIPNRKFVSFF